MLSRSHLAPASQDTMSTKAIYGTLEKTHGEENQNVPLGLGSVDLENGRYSGVEIISFWLWRIMDIHRISSTRDYIEAGEAIGRRM